MIKSEHVEKVVYTMSRTLQVEGLDENRNNVIGSRYFDMYLNGPVESGLIVAIMGYVM
jgi:hypothetical protein